MPWGMQASIGQGLQDRRRVWPCPARTAPALPMGPRPGLCRIDMRTCTAWHYASVSQAVPDADKPPQQRMQAARTQSYELRIHGCAVCAVMCGVCAFAVHTSASRWQPTPAASELLPMVPVVVPAASRDTSPYNLGLHWRRGRAPSPAAPAGRGPAPAAAAATSMARHVLLQPQAVLLRGASNPLPRPCRRPRRPAIGGHLYRLRRATLRLALAQLWLERPAPWRPLLRHQRG